MYKHSVCIFTNWARKLYLAKIPIIPNLLRIFVRIIYSAEIPYTADIHPSVDYSHNGLGVVIHGDARIAEEVLIYQNVTIGNKGPQDKGQAPVIHKNVIVGAGACILGDVVIGENAFVGANAVVLKDVPSGSIAIGIPAKIIENNQNNDFTSK